MNTIVDKNLESDTKNNRRSRNSKKRHMAREKMLKY